MRRQDDGHTSPALVLRRVIDAGRVVLVTHTWRPTTVVDQAPGHAVVRRVLQVQFVVDVRNEQVVAAHDQIKL